jgi:uncharacterized membrane protein YkoI
MRTKTMMSVLFAALIAVAAGAGATTTAKTKSSTHKSSTTKPKVSADSARAIALAEVPGAKVKSHELEHENGKYVYSFDLAVPGKSGIEEVQVDAMTGKVVSHEHETAEQEKTEAGKEKHEHPKTK